MKAKTRKNSSGHPITTMHFFQPLFFRFFVTLYVATYVARSLHTVERTPKVVLHLFAVFHVCD